MIELKNIGKEFQGHVVLENININFEGGNIYGIVGKNGSGKTILLKIMTGLCEQSEGEVIIDSEVREKGTFTSQLGLVSDCIGFLPQYTARENLYALARINKKIGYEEIDEILRMVGLEPESKKVYRKFSLGMKQKLAIAQAFMEKPKILLLDEPMNGLDEDSTDDMRAYFKKYVLEHNAVMVITSHHREDIEKLCNYVYKIKNGKISLETDN